MTRETSHTELAPHVPVAELVRVYEQARADIIAGFDLLARATASMDAVFKSDYSEFYIYSHKRTVVTEADETLQQLRRATWWRIVERLEIRRMLSVARAKELDRQLEKGELPELTVQSVADFTEFYLSHGREMLHEAVAEVFSFLRPPGSEYKTNTELEIRERCILDGWVTWGHFGKFEVKYWRAPEFIALDNVFAMLDGQGSIAKTYKGELADAVEKSGARGVGETRYFAFKCFRKGTLHLRFKRLDLLAKLNQIAGGMNLKPAQAAA